LRHALERGVDPTLLDSGGATPMHAVESLHDNVNPEIVRRLAAAGAAVDAGTPSGTRPIELAAQRILPATVAALVELGAEPGRGLDALLTWWPTIGVRYWKYRAGEVAGIVELLRVGGAEVTESHRQKADAAGTREVSAALR
jgi:uncharacterized protein